MISLLLAATLKMTTPPPLTCAALKPPEIAALAGKDTKVTLAVEKTSLDRVFKALGEQAGFKPSFRGFTPVIGAHYADAPLRQVLADLAERYVLRIQATAPDRLEIAGPIASGVGGVTPPLGKSAPLSRPSSCPDPVGARSQAAVGKVVFQVVVCEDGHVGAVAIAPDTASSVQADCLLDSVRRLTFEPATKDGKPVAVSYTLSVEFAPD